MEIASTSTAIDMMRSILWQYDHARNLVTLISELQGISTVATTDFWQRFISDVMNADTATGAYGNPFTGLDSLGRVIGVPRPATVAGVSASDDLYRRLLKAHVILSFEDASSKSIGKYLVTLFGAERQIDISALNPKVGDSIVIGGITYTFIPASSEYGALNEVKLGSLTEEESSQIEEEALASLPDGSTDEQKAEAVDTALNSALDVKTAENLAAVVNGDDGYSEDGVLIQNSNPNVYFPGDTPDLKRRTGASVEGSVVTLKNEYWYAEGKTATANVAVLDNADMTIDYRIVTPANLSTEEKEFLEPYDPTTGILEGGEVFGYTREGEKRIGYIDPNEGIEVENPAFPVLFPFPAGVRTHLATPEDPTSPLGLNENDGSGQDKANFVYDESQPNGAPYFSDVAEEQP